MKGLTEKTGCSPRDGDASDSPQRVPATIRRGVNPDRVRRPSSLPVVERGEGYSMRRAAERCPSPLLDHRRIDMNTTPQGAEMVRWVSPRERKSLAPNVGAGQWLLVRWPLTGVFQLYDGVAYRSLSVTA